MPRLFVKGEIPHAEYARNKEIYYHHLSGVPDTRIGDMYGLSRQRVHQIIKEAGLAPRRALTDEKREQIAEMVRQGRTVREIAELTGVQRSYVLSVTHEAGLKTNRHPRDMVRQMDEIIRLATEKGISIYSLTKHDRGLRERTYRLAKDRGIVFSPTIGSVKTKRHRDTVKRIIADV